MLRDNPDNINIIEHTSYIWHKLFLDIKIPTDGTIVEIAPGYEPKIGNALSLLGFHGTVFLIEPDKKAACHIQNVYQRILPHAKIHTVYKLMQNVHIGSDITHHIDALLASHPFDDMVMAFILKQTTFFSKEKEQETYMPPSTKNIYDSMRNDDYVYGIEATITAWKRFIEKLKPHYVIASQYPSRTLTIKGLTKRQNSGFIVLKKLKNFYRNSLIKQPYRHSLGSKADPKWWLVRKQPSETLKQSLLHKPLAIKRLGKSIFVPQQARRLHTQEYDIVYIDKEYFGNVAHNKILKSIQDFAITIDDKRNVSCKTITTYADRQKDKTDISLSGNQGSGRAVYFGDKFNILGVGKTTLCKSMIPSHSTGRLELVGAMRRVILSKWINHFTQRTPTHPLLIALKETARFKWNDNPIPLSLLVRIDDGSLDRPSHVEQSPKIPVDFEKTVTEYAKLDAEYFAYRILLGAWSTSNYSLRGHIIDLESASFVTHRGPYYTSSSTHPENRFGYEGLGFLKIVRQLASVKNIHDAEIENKFYKERSKHLSRCFLSLLGIDEVSASSFFTKHQNKIINISRQFEILSKKTNNQITDLKLYTLLLDNKDPSLLDMSCLFRNLRTIYESQDREKKAFELLIRKNALLHVQPGATYINSNQVELFLENKAVISYNTLEHFLADTKQFIHSLFDLLVLLESEKCLDNKKDWNDRLQAANQNMPTMFELNTILISLVESYRLRKKSPQAVSKELEKLCKLPYASAII